MKIGIEAASFFVPTLYLEIKDLAEKRGIEPAKLEKGLGLKKWLSQMCTKMQPLLQQKLY
jgi:3-hydroxy-3-methylglutaryl CoA synthase